MYPQWRALQPQKNSYSCHKDWGNKQHSSDKQPLGHQFHRDTATGEENTTADPCVLVETWSSAKGPENLI